MNRFIGILLCLSGVKGEAIPESLTRGSIQDFLCREAVRLHKPYHSGDTPLQEETSTSENTSPPSFFEELKQSGTNFGTQQEAVEPKPLNVSVPKVAKVNEIPEDATPLSEPVPTAPASGGVEEPKVSVEPEKPAVIPGFPTLQKVLTPEIESAQKRAKDLYGREKGYAGVTDKVVTAADGRRFLYVNIKPDGNCGFYAAGVDRAQFVAAIEDLINEQHAAYQAFVNERVSIADFIASVRFTDDKTNVIDKSRCILKQADNGDSLNKSLLVLSDYEAKKMQYRAELFQDALKDLIQKLQSLESDVKVRSNAVLAAQINSFIAGVVSANCEDKNIHGFIKANGAKIIAELQKINVRIEHIISALNKTQDILSYPDEKLFEEFKLRLINQVQNLTTKTSYEAFLIALRAELVASSIRANDLASKEEVLTGVKKVFSLNRGAATWFPGGLFGALKDRLKVKYNIWRSSNNGRIQLCSSTGDERGISEKGAGVRNMFFTGAHYDLLFPMDD